MKRFTGTLLAVCICLLLIAATGQSATPSKTAAGRVGTVAIQADQGNPDIKVWINTASGVYHCPGTRWYGATKHGTYMRQADAQKNGYRPAYGKVCR